MSKIILSTLVCIALSLAGGPLFAKEEQEKFRPVYATVLQDKVNIRAGCGLNFEVLGQLNKGAQVAVIDQEYGWYKIKLPKRALSFVHKDYINKDTVRANKLRVRAGAGVNFNVLGILEKGETVKILGQEGQWLKVVPPEGCLGWVKKNYLRLLEKRFFPKKTKVPFLGQNKQKKIEVHGQIDDLGRIVNRRGTHKLVAGEKILYYLKSENLNLNHYVYQKAKIVGKLEDWQDSTYPVIDVEQIKTE